jgi:DNA-binding MarR family transcriptional regulator
LSIFDLDQQNSDLSSKITAGLERLSQVFRTLLWEKAKENQLSPIQIQILLFIANHAPQMATVSYLALEFNVTKATISDAVKTLEQKKLLAKNPDKNDARSFILSLTKDGKNVIKRASDFAQSFLFLIQRYSPEEKKLLWDVISDLIKNLHEQGIISVQRTCHTCKHHQMTGRIHHCLLLERDLKEIEIRMDCPDFDLVQDQ